METDRDTVEQSVETFEKKIPAPSSSPVANNAVSSGKTDYSFYLTVIALVIAVICGIKMRELSQRVDSLQRIINRPDVVYINVDELVKQAEQQGITFIDAQTAITAITYHAQKTGSTLVIYDSGTVLAKDAKSVTISDVLDVISQANSKQTSKE